MAVIARADRAEDGLASGHGATAPPHLIAEHAVPAETGSDGDGPTEEQEARVVFSAREKALVELLAAGHTDASAARRLGVSPRTVSYTLQSLMDRLEVENRFQLGLALGTLGTHDGQDGPETP